MIGGHYLVIQQWQPDLFANDKIIDRMTVWIRIKSLALEYMNTAFLRKFGNEMGNLFKIDMNTADQARDRFARLCVEIDLNKPLKTYLRKKNRWFKLEYEGLSMVCSDYGRCGHTREGCKEKDQDNQTANE